MALQSLGIIPARFASSRFPGKPLVMINGKSMIMRVYEQARKSKTLNKIIVATDDERIFNHVLEAGGEVMMTAGSHVSGTSRIGEVVSALSSSGKCPYDIVVNIQGDEPFIEPAQIDLAVSVFQNPEAKIGTLISRVSDTADLMNPNVVKVVTDHSGRAMYFSRSPIPFLRGGTDGDWAKQSEYFRHIGLYAFRTQVLLQLIDLPAVASEVAESLEQLRWMYHGYSIHTALTDIETIGIDAPEDLLKLTNNA